MKKCVNLLAMLALFGFVMPVMAAPQEVAVDDRPIVGGEVDPDDVEDAVELDEAESGWALGGCVGVTFHSKQVTYGLIDNPHGILQPAAELSFGHDDFFTLAIGVESFFDTTNYGAKDGGYNDRRWKYQELDPYASLSRSWGLWEETSLYTEIGYFYEYHPRSCNKPALEYSYPDAQYVTATVGLKDNLLNPTFKMEYQIEGYGEETDDDGEGALYLTFSISHEFDLSEALGLEEGSLCLTPTLGVGAADKHRNMCDLGLNESFSLRDAFASVELSYCPVEGLFIVPYIACHQQLDSDTRDVVKDDEFVAYFGIGVSYEF